MRLRIRDAVRWKRVLKRELLKRALRLERLCAAAWDVGMLTSRQCRDRPRSKGTIRALGGWVAPGRAV